MAQVLGEESHSPEQEGQEEAETTLSPATLAPASLQVLFPLFPPSGA